MLALWVLAFCSAIAAAGFGAPRALPSADVDAPISVSAEVQGRGTTGMLLVQVVLQEIDASAQMELSLPDGVRLVSGKGRAEAALSAGKPRIFRFPLRAAKPGVYVIGVKVMAGEDSYRFGKSCSVAWIAQGP